MKQTYNVCTSCFTSIASFQAAHIWKDLAFAIEEDDPFLFIDGTELSPQGRGKFEKALHVLETSKFIVSQEYPEQGWLIKVHGIDPQSAVVCCGDHC